MATIRAAIALYDGVTAPLMHMNRALHVVLNSFEAMQAAGAHPVDTAAIRQAREELARAETAFDSIEEAIRRGERRQRGFNQSVRDGTQAAGGLLSRVRQIGAAVGGAIAVRRLVGISDTLTGTTARLNLLADDGGSVEELEQKIMASAMRSRSAYFDTAQMVAKMGLNAGAAFESNDELIAFAEQVNKQFIIGGANAVEQKNAIIQLTQAMAAGALRGEELNSILEGAPGIARAIEQYMGIAEGSIKKYASQGLVTAEVVKNALFSVADETNRKFESMPLTWSQVFTMAGNVALKAFRPLLAGINLLANHIDIIGPAVLGLAAAFAVFQIAAHWTQIAKLSVPGNLRTKDGFHNILDRHRIRILIKLHMDCHLLRLQPGLYHPLIGNQPQDALNQGRFARTVGTDYPHSVAFRNLDGRLDGKHCIRPISNGQILNG